DRRDVHRGYRGVVARRAFDGHASDQRERQGQQRSEDNTRHQDRLPKRDDEPRQWADDDDRLDLHTVASFRIGIGSAATSTGSLWNAAYSSGESLSNRSSATRR